MFDSNIKRINNYVVVFNFIFVIFIFLLIQNIKSDNTQIYGYENDRYEMMQIADKLRQSSDDLTHFARTYVVTSNKLFKQQYFDTLSIRNGEKNRPRNYNTIYWDLESSQRIINHPDGTKISLKKLISLLPYEKSELQKLTLAEKNSNDLASLEIEAFNAMDGLFKNTKGEYLLNKEPNHELAIKVMHSEAYYLAKHKIMKPIDDFMLAVDKRTLLGIESLENRIEYKFYILYLLLFVFIIANIIFFLGLKKINNSITQKLKKSISDAVEDNRKKDELLFRQSKHAAMGEMIGSIAHQWRQPLNAIAGHIQMIEFDHEDKIIDDKYIQTFIDENMILVNFMSNTIDDFRDFFRIDKVKKEFNAKKAIMGTLNLIISQLNEKSIQTNLDLDEKCFVFGFESEFQQVVLNIINNSKDELIKKNRKKALISISIFKNMNFTVFKISDNAGGIPEKIIDRIFEPYFTTKEQGQGTGLGLYMSKMIIENNMGGHISVSNTESGAEFTIVFVDKEEEE